MFHLRSPDSIFKLVLGISIGVVVFIIIQMSYLPSNDQRELDFDGTLEQRLIHLESDISQNRHVAGQLHKAVKELMTAAPPPDQHQQADQLDVAANQHQQAAPQRAAAEWQQERQQQRRQPGSMAGFCEFGQQSPKTTDGAGL
ncbi:uncharacterized protein LOC119095238 [Pollicipes pollicipes]|uniref:uncharacterized protein LOC119095238 n=1 Tax=Pollicipes pollicipes TaxID=41117 RepID=UPI001884B9F7|nr:uncharacterized protein LOC119095238 [Pollicipes pollicipes]